MKNWALAGRRRLSFDLTFFFAASWYLNNRLIKFNPLLVATWMLRYLAN